MILHHMHLASLLRRQLAGNFFPLLEPHHQASCVLPVQLHVRQFSPFSSPVTKVTGQETKNCCPAPQCSATKCMDRVTLIILHSSSISFPVFTSCCLHQGLAIRKSMTFATRCVTAMSIIPAKIKCLRFDHKNLVQRCSP